MSENKNTVPEQEIKTETEKNKKAKSMAPQVDERIKYYILAIAIVLIIAVVFIVVNEAKHEDARNAGTGTAQNTTQAAGTGTKQNAAQNGEQSITQSSSGDDDKVYPIQFDYFVTKSDENYDEYMSMVKELEEKYGESILFDIKDIDEDPTVRDKFPVDAFGTPMLIIVTDSGDFAAMEGKCTDRDKIEGYIKDTLENRKHPEGAAAETKKQ